MVVGSVLRAPIPEAGRQYAVLTVAAVLIVREFGVFKFPIPQNARLVPQFVTRIPFWGAVQFGAEMGTGMRTYSPTGLPHIVVAAIVLWASWGEAIAAGTGFALGRALMLLIFLAARNKEGADAAFEKGMPRLRPVFATLLAPLIVMLVLLW
ncbi:hypothetical protein C1I95_08540 [Micromonospora craterilacus]|uniref:Uncharacterized protein n=1 Tax=Micromonospora craterilacus TaxID=1655439 RepID=A0A2W2EEL9_9ACTN|nr:hypothetical protein C1I95_08540 [Micromonospora craterilacus]